MKNLRKSSGRGKGAEAGHREGGASLVEFAVMMPLLILILLGMLEFGWAMAQQIDVRSKVREGLRLAIVDQPLTDVEARICRNDIVNGSDITSIVVDSGVDVGEPITLTVTTDLNQITGLFGVFWGPNPDISSSVEGRVEQESSFMPAMQELAPCP